jgi:hypothetical protein
MGDDSHVFGQKSRGKAHVSFPDRLSNRCQGLRRTFSEIYT